MSKSIPDSTPENTITPDTLATANNFRKRDHSQIDIEVPENPFVSTMAVPAQRSPGIPLSYNASKSLPSKPRMLNNISLNKPDLTSKFAQVWPLVDRLELALKKLEIASWQFDRIQDNMQPGPKRYTEDHYQKKAAIHLNRLERDLLSFGLSEEKVRQAITSLKMHEAGIGLPGEVRHTISQDDTLLRALQSFGVSSKNDPVRSLSCSLMNLVLR